ncbi:hypothetical protein TSH58p_12870 [Azospirillum sp. TSH58]|nr:hypothetical protein TSH58p_12870 [Azospirillum sp. TSH58]
MSQAARTQTVIQRRRSFHRNTTPNAMSRVISVLFVLFLFVIGGGMAFLASWDMPAPSKTVEKVIPDERFPR